MVGIYEPTGYYVPGMLKQEGFCLQDTDVEVVGQ